MKYYSKLKNGFYVYSAKKTALIAILIMAILLIPVSNYINYTFASSTTKVFLTPSTNSVSQGSNVNIGVNLNTGGENITSAKVVINYDVSKLEFVSFDYSSSSFSIHSDTFNKVESGKLSYNTSAFTGVNSANANIFSIRFKSIGSGSSSVTVSQPESVLLGPSSELNPPNLLSVVEGASVDISSPTPDPEPNPPTTNPTPNPTPDPEPNPPTPNPTPISEPSPTSNSSNPKTSNWSQPSVNLKKDQTQAPQSSSATAPQIANVEINNLGYRSADISWSTDKPSNSILNLGADKDSLAINVKSDGIKNAHSVRLDENYLTPGTTFYFKITSSDEAGEKTVSETYSFVTKGYDVVAQVVDKQANPVSEVIVTLNSDTRISETDENGNASFYNVAPGQHTVSFEYGGEVYSQSINVEDKLNVLTSAVQYSEATGQAQVFTVSLDQSVNRFINNLIWIIIIPIVLIVSYFIIRKGIPVLHRKNNGASFNNSTSINVGNTPDDINSSVSQKSPIELVDGVPIEKPGSTITPKNNDSDTYN